MKILFYLTGICLVVLYGFINYVSLPVEAAVAPALPQVYVDTTYPSLNSNRTVRVVKASCTDVSNCYTSLQTAINEADLGDEIVIDAGMTARGTITLRNKTTGSGWIIIRTSNMSGLPPAGTRVGPQHASAMAKILAPGQNARAIQTENNAHHYRLVGLEVTESANDDSNTLIMLGNNDSQCATATEPYRVCDQSVFSTYAHHLILDRMYIHGTTTHNVKNGVVMNSKEAAIIDSYISEIHVQGQDAVAIGGSNGPGPFKIVNNYVSSSTENIIFGGDDPRVQGLVTADVEIRNNYIHKPMSWHADDPSYIGRHWVVKNLFELKNATRVLIDGNIMENNWTDGQDGNAILLNTTNQLGKCTWCEVSDVTFTNNIVRHSGSAIAIQANDYNFNSVSTGITRRIRIHNNLFYDINGTRWRSPYNDSRTSAGLFLHMPATSEDGAIDVDVNHNTVINTGRIMNLADCRDTATGARCQSSTPAANKDYATKPRFNFTNNIVYHSTYGIFGESSGIDGGAIAAYFPDGVVRGNIIVGTRSATDLRNWSSSFGTYATGNHFPATWTEVGFTGLTSDDYRLSSSSIYRNLGTDSRAIGADIDTINTATARVISGNSGNTPPPPPPAGDTTDPIISGVTVSSITPDGATVSWDTDEASDSQIQYGLTISYGSSTTINSSRITSHSQTLTNLSPSTLYNFRVRSRDAAGNLASSSNFTFTTQADTPTPPPTPPTPPPPAPLPTPPPPALPLPGNVYRSSVDFSSTQGQRNWSYRDSGNNNLTFTANNEWQGSERYLLAFRNGAHPGVNGDSVRRWTAPSNGNVTITDHVYDWNVSCGDGVLVTIKKNSTNLWSNVVNTAAGIDVNLNTPVVAGDNIDFVVNMRSNNSCDTTMMDPVITLTSTTSTPAPSPSPSPSPTPRPSPLPSPYLTPRSGGGGGSPTTPRPEPFPAPAPTSGSGSLTLSRNLSLGTRGTDVTTLQNHLISLGYLSSGNSTGYYGPLTVQAVKQYQCQRSIVCSGDPATTGYGAVGPKTRISLNGSTTTAPTPIPTTPPTPSTSSGSTTFTRDLSLGSRGTDVIALQNYLIANNYLSPGNATGYYGPLTRAAVIKFQIANNITPAVGYFGPMTRGRVGR